jgi:hypothetical protein
MTTQRWRCLAWLAALPVLVAPIGDPDMWWHLSAAERLVESASWPKSDWLSFTLGGAAWSNFEWLAQLFFYLPYKLAGYAGLWILKIVLLGGILEWVWRRLLKQVDAPAAALGVALMSCALLPRADIRTELFSLIAFAWLLRFIEEKKDQIQPRRALVLAALFFCIWANLHAGFAYGLVLLALYIVGALIAKEKSAMPLFAGLLGGACGALINPYGIGVYTVLFSHATDSAALAQYIVEWGPLTVARKEQWPTILLVAGAVALLSRRWKKEPAGFVLALLIFGAAGIRHARLAAYFSLLAVPFVIAGLASESRRRWVPAVLAACALFAAALNWNTGLGRATVHAEYVPVKAAAFIERTFKNPAMHFYHPWGWGGFLGRDFVVFQDGRYIFHPLLVEAGQASAAPQLWQQFLQRHKIDVALMRNTGLTLPGRRRYPDGSERAFQRPYTLSFMPRSEWALIYFDAKALLFLRRTSANAQIIADLEYRYVRPGDRAALRDALARGEIDVALLERERARHARILSTLPDSL